MSQVEIKLSIDFTKPEQVSALTTLAEVIAETTEQPVKKTRTRKLTTEKPEKEIPIATGPTNDGGEKAIGEPAKGAEAIQNSSTEDKTPTKEEMKLLIAQKVEDNRPVLKAKLEELGAASWPKLDSSKYTEFKEFLISLD